MTKNKTIWSNDLGIDDYKEWLEEYKDIMIDNDEEVENLERLDYNDTRFNEWLNDTLEFYIENERDNLNIECSNSIIAIADLGLWNGRRIGYKVISSGNIKDTLYSDDDYVAWYIDKYDYKAIMKHHDGTNYIVYRELKDEKYLDILEEKAYNGTLTNKDLTRYTRSLKSKILKAYEL